MEPGSGAFEGLLKELVAWIKQTFATKEELTALEEQVQELKEQGNDADMG